MDSKGYEKVRKAVERRFELYAKTEVPAKGEDLQFFEIRTDKPSAILRLLGRAGLIAPEGWTRSEGEPTGPILKLHGIHLTYDEGGTTKDGLIFEDLNAQPGIAEVEEPET